VSRQPDNLIASTIEKHLRSLQITRRKKIDEIKEATRYDHLRNLLEKYDDTAVSKSPSNSKEKGAKGRESAKGSTSAAKTTSAKQESPQTPGPLPQTTPKGAAGMTQGSTNSATSQASSTVVAQIQAAPAEKTLLDRVADKIFGAEVGGQASGAEQRYALICRICSSHNGLCPKEEWEEVRE
jgi:hypothetical protein